MNNDISIYGAGGLGREVLTIIRALPEWEEIRFFDDGIKRGSIVNGVEVLGGMEELKNLKHPQVIIAIADPVVKMEIVSKLNLISEIQFPSIVHPSAILLDVARTKIGEGTIITAGCILTTGISIGNHVLLNLNCTVGHDVVIDDYVSIMPGVNLAGRVQIDKSAFIGSAAQIIKQSRVGEFAKVGSGSVVTRNVPANSTVAGVPARVLKK